MRQDIKEDVWNALILDSHCNPIATRSKGGRAGQPQYLDELRKTYDLDKRIVELHRVHFDALPGTDSYIVNRKS